MESGEVEQEARIKSSGSQRGARSARPCRHCEVPGQRATVGLNDSDPGWGWLALRLASPWVTWVGGSITEVRDTERMLGKR